MNAVTVSALHVYPVKGLQGHALASAAVERCGLAGDRRWMVVDPAGRFMTQRQCPDMAKVAAKHVADDLALSVPGRGRLLVPRPGMREPTVAVTVWRSTVPAQLADAASAAWLSQALGVACRLAYLADPAARPVDPAYGAESDRVSFADGFPLLLTAVNSLRDLDGRLGAPVPMRRFRPNIVVDGTPAWAEDCWRRIRIGAVVFRLPKPCSRCLVITVDQETGQRPDRQEPLRTLARFRRTEGGVMFGQNMIPESLGQIAVGDLVTVLEAGPSNVTPMPLAEVGSAGADQG